MEKITFVNGQAPFLNEQNLNQLQTNIENAIEAAKNEVNENVPTKITDLENDSNFLVKDDDFNTITGRVHITNSFDDYQERKVDLSLGYLVGAESGGSVGTLHINEKCDTDVHVLKGGEGTLFYKEKEVATQEYVDEQISNSETTTKEYIDEQISNIETSGGGISEIPIASTTTLGGIKVGMNLSIEKDGTLNVIGGSSGGSIDGSSGNGEVLPIGTMVPFGSKNNVPSNWRVCDGSEVSRTTYVDLFNVIGTSYGEGDGETTFNLPNKCGRVSVGLDEDQDEFNHVGLKDGEKNHQLTIEEMPSHSHEFVRSRLFFAETAYENALGATSNASNSAIARTSATGSGVSHNNLQPYEVDVWIIKVSNVVSSLETTEGTIVDNLTSTSSTDALSANMGRELKEKIENIDVLEEYSTEEKVIGKWIDGKTLHEKTFIATSKTIDLSGLNYDTLLITYFGMYVSNYIMTPYYTSSSDYLKILVTDQKQLSMITSHTSFTKAIMVVRYTKKA